MPSSLLESDIEKYLVRRVEQLGGEVRKVKWVGRRGAPDRLVLAPWGFFWVELKRPKGGRLEPHQIREHERLRQFGQRVEVFTTKEAIDLLLGYQGLL